MSFYVYKFLNEKSEIIYIGQTINLEQRIENQHFTDHGHLPKECYDEAKKVMYGELNTKLDMDLMEIYLIGKYRPKYNITYNKHNVTLSIDEPNWIEYNRELKTNNITVKIKFEKYNTSSPIVREILQKHRLLESLNIQKNDKNKLIENNEIKIESNDLIEEKVQIKEEVIEKINKIETEEKIKIDNQEKVIHNKLGNILIKYGLNQSELAKKTKSSRTTISNIVRGVYTPSLNLALRISEVFQLSVQDIFYLDEK